MVVFAHSALGTAETGRRAAVLRDNEVDVRLHHRRVTHAAFFLVLQGRNNSY